MKGSGQDNGGAGEWGGGDILSNWLSFGKKKQRGVEMNGEHYMFYGSQLGQGHAPCLLLLPPFSFLVLDVQWLFLGHVNQTLLQYVQYIR